METGRELCVVGRTERATAIGLALASVGLPWRAVSPEVALGRPGVVVGSPALIWAFPPGRHPTLETQGYASGTCAVYAHWSGTVAEVGPVLVRGSGPCVACLFASAASNGRGGHPALRSWVAAWAALQCEALLRTGSSELIGASWRWRLNRPGLDLVRWRALPGCGARDCQP